MSRYRPPSPPKSPYITREGFDILKNEEKEIWQKRRLVVSALSAAAAEGDRSENAEYIYRKKELRELDRRIRYLQKRLPDINVVNTTPTNAQQVFFSATITLENEDGIETSYRIVGPDEIDHHPHYISIDSPVAKALLKKNLNDQVTVSIPTGKITYVITNIRY